MEDLVVGPLQEGGVDGDHRPHPLHGQAGGEGHGVLFADAHVEEAVRELLAEIHQPGAVGHGRGDGHDALGSCRARRTRVSPKTSV